jgi:hypothetical protein
VSRVPPAHRATTANLGAAYPFLSRQGFRGDGVVIGTDLLGGAFRYDPFFLYRAGVISNPNMVVMGQIGRGKSAFVKSYLWRQSLLGRQAWVVDPKGEYSRLAEAWGVKPLRLQPGGTVRLNPLDLGRGRAELLGALLEGAFERPLSPRERACLEVAIDDAASCEGLATVPLVVEALLSPTPQAAASLRTDVTTLQEDGRDVALELRRLVHGDLAGMFDGPTTPGIDLSAPLVVLDLSPLYHSQALGTLMTCALAWLGAFLSRRPGGQCLLVIDEAWAILARPGVARWLQASWKLSRAWGVANVAVIHHVSDLAAAGPDGSETVKLAQGLLADSETVVVYAQPPGELERSVAWLGLNETEAGLLPRLGRGVALWKVGGDSFLVEHVMSDAERSLTATDAKMLGREGED